jgi:hypothetical protein
VDEGIKEVSTAEIPHPESVVKLDTLVGDQGVVSHGNGPARLMAIDVSRTETLESANSYPQLDRDALLLDLAGPVGISPATSEYGAQSPDIVISAPPEYGLPSYRLNLKPPRPRTGQAVLIRPPKGSLLPPIRIRHRRPKEHYVPEFPEPRSDSWRPAERPQKPTRRHRSYYWPPPNGDPLHQDSFLAMPLSKDSSGAPHTSQQGFWFLPTTKELPSIDSVLDHGRSKPVWQVFSTPSSSCLHLVASETTSILAPGDHGSSNSFG